MIHTCTRCELRFTTEGELREHLVVDHAADPESLERGRYPADRSSFRPLYDTSPEQRANERRYLVVANQTLGGDALRDKVGELRAAGDVRFHVLVPAGSDEAGAAQASFRLRRTVDELQEQGLAATGSLGPEDPYEAVSEILRVDEFDEVILSTLPASASRWLGLDLPTRIERAYKVPVQVVTAGG